jgi:hypothetical protein
MKMLAQKSVLNDKDSDVLKSVPLKEVNMVDLSSLVPPSLDAKTVDDWLIIQSKNISGPKVLAKIKKRAPLAEFCYFLGLLRSEGGKKHLNPKQISFVNMDVKLHSEFVRIAKMLGTYSIKAYLYHSGKAAPDEVDKLAKSFEGATGERISKIHLTNQKARITLMMYINNAAVTRLLLHSEPILRKMMSTGAFNIEYALEYLRGVTDGDGSIQLNIREDLRGGYLGPKLSIQESDADAAWDIWHLMKRLGFTTYIRPRRAYDLGAKLALSQTLMLLEHDFFKYSPCNYMRLLCHVALAKLKEKRVWMLADAFGNDAFTARDAAKIFDVKSPEKARRSLNYYTQLGLLRYDAGKNHTKIFRLTERGMHQIKLIDKALNELKRIQSTVGAKNVKELLVLCKKRENMGSISQLT